MRILGFDTATRATTVALSDAATGLELEARDDPAAGARPAHATRLLELMTELLDTSGGGWEAVDRIAVGIGPGTFTGVRIGIATARALARARGIPLVGVSTLRSLALGAQTLEHDGPVLAVLDARRKEVFAAAWRSPEQIERGQPVLEPAALAPERLAQAIRTRWRAPLAIGDGAVEFRLVLERSGAWIPEGDSGLHRVTAINHCRLASTLRVRSPDEVAPEYLRIPDAEIAHRAKRHQ